MQSDIDLSTSFPRRGLITPIKNPAIDHWSPIRCGSYTAEWTAQTLGIQSPSANSSLWGPIWLDLFRPVVPSDMQKLFKVRGMTTIEVCLKDFTDEERLQWIRNEIVIKKRPPVILIRTRILHWIAVGGYDDDRATFFIYDPGVGKDSLNPRLPIGNAEISYQDFLKRWRGRWWMEYVAIVVTNVDIQDPKKEKIKEVLEAYTKSSFK